MLDFYKIESKLIPGWFSAYDMEEIYRAFKTAKETDNYLEIGVDRGRSLTYATKYYPGEVYGIDISTIKQRGGKRVPKGATFIHGDSLEVEWDKPIQTLFIDGEHRYKRVKGEWDKYYPHLVKGGWVFFHDADSTSPEVEQFAREQGATFSDNPRCSMAWVRK